MSRAPATLDRLRRRLVAGGLASPLLPVAPLLPSRYATAWLSPALASGSRSSCMSRFASRSRS